MDDRNPCWTRRILCIDGDRIYLTSPISDHRRSIKELCSVSTRLSERRIVPLTITQLWHIARLTTFRTHVYTDLATNLGRFTGMELEFSEGEKEKRFFFVPFPFTCYRDSYSTSTNATDLSSQHQWYSSIDDSRINGKTRSANFVLDKKCEAEEEEEVPFRRRRRSSSPLLTSASNCVSEAKTVILDNGRASQGESLQTRKFLSGKSGAEARESKETAEVLVVWEKQAAEEKLSTRDLLRSASKSASNPRASAVSRFSGLD